MSGGDYSGSCVQPIVVFEDTEAGRRIVALEAKVTKLVELLVQQIERQAKEDVEALRG